MSHPQASPVRLASVAAALLLAVPLAPRAHAASLQEEGDPEVLFVRAERVIVRPGVELEDSAVIVRDGRVVVVGEGLAPPEGARVLECAVLCAGFLDPWSSLGIDGSSLTDLRTNAATRAVDGFDPYSDDELRIEALRAGVTAVRIQAGIKAPLSGVGAVVRNHPELDGEDGIVLEDACFGATVAVARDTGMQITFNEATGEFQISGGASLPDVFDRLSELDRLVSMIESGKEYAVEQTEYRYELEEWRKAIAEKEEELEKDAKKARKKREKEMEEAEEKGKEFKEARYKEDRKPRQPKFDPEKEVMARVASGELPLIVEVHGYPELRGLLDKTAELDRLRLVVAGATHAEPFAEELARRRIPVILMPEPERLPADDGLTGHNLGLAARLSEAGVHVLFGSGATSPGDTRDLPTLVNLAIAHGLEPERAFEALTVGAARALDVADRLGTVEVGKDADLLLLDGDPLSSATRVLYVINGGEVVVQP